MRLAIHPGKQGAVRHRQRHEGEGRIGKKAKAAEAVRMGGDQAQLDARHLPEKAHPDEQPEIPAQQQELEDRQAHIDIPHPGEARVSSPRRTASRTTWPCREPRSGARMIRMPTPYTKAISSTSASTELRSRNADAMARIEPRQGALGDQIAVQELLHHRPHAPVHHQLGNDQQRQRHQEADMYFHVQQERHGRAPAQQLPFQSREQQQRQPGEQRDDEDALAQQLSASSGQVRPAQKLEKRPAQDERKILGLLKILAYPYHLSEIYRFGSC